VRDVTREIVSVGAAAPRADAPPASTAPCTRLRSAGGEVAAVTFFAGGKYRGRLRLCVHGMHPSLVAEVGRSPGRIALYVLARADIPHPPPDARNAVPYPVIPLRRDQDYEITTAAATAATRAPLRHLTLTPASASASAAPSRHTEATAAGGGGAGAVCEFAVGFGNAIDADQPYPAVWGPHQKSVPLRLQVVGLDVQTGVVRLVTGLTQPLLIRSKMVRGSAVEEGGGGRCRGTRCLLVWTGVVPSCDAM
jgi:hypothetical protein